MKRLLCIHFVHLYENEALVILSQTLMDKLGTVEKVGALTFKKQVLNFKTLSRWEQALLSNNYNFSAHTELLIDCTLIMLKDITM